jgi:4-hydroxybenzoate polyprenyltransferase
MMELLRKTARFVRWRDWGPGKIPVLCTTAYYVGLANRDVSSAFILDFALFLIFAALQSALGYVINDWGDRAIDAAHGKPNAIGHLPRKHALFALGTLASTAFLSGLPFVQRPMVLPLWAGWVFVTIAYSLKPLRLKERGAWGLSVSFVAQWSLPILLAFAALSRFGGGDMILFAVAATISGATLEIAHQRWDRTRDLSTGTATMGGRISAGQLNQLYFVALMLDRFATGIIVLVVMLGVSQSPIGSLTVSPILLLVGVYIALLLVAMYETLQTSSRGTLLDPYYSKGHSASKLLHETFSNLMMPAYLMALATIIQPINGILFLFFLFWRLVLGQADWRWPLRAFVAWWHNKGERTKPGG